MFYKGSKLINSFLICSCLPISDCRDLLESTQDCLLEHCFLVIILWSTLFHKIRYDSSLFFMIYNNSWFLIILLSLKRHHYFLGISSSKKMIKIIKRVMSAVGLLVRKLLISGNCWSDSFTSRETETHVYARRKSNLCALFTLNHQKC